MEEEDERQEGVPILEDRTSLHAKAIFLGDEGTGKSKLIESLAPLFAARAGSSSAELFNIVEFDASEMENSNVNVVLKIWECANKVDPIAFQGSLFCIITLDIRSQESMASAFSKWMEVKEKYMDSCFLVVVGCFLDKSICRQCNIKELCALCAEKDAVYCEVSNVDGTNIPLLRKILCSRLDHVRRIRQEFIDNKEHFSGARPLVPELDTGVDGQGGEGKSNNYDFSAETSVLDAPFLEHNILSDSIGNILSSCVGTEYWPGLENEKESLTKIGNQIGDLINKLGQKDAKFPKNPIVFNLPTQQPLGSAEEPSQEELREAFSILGFKLPVPAGGDHRDHAHRVASTTSESAADYMLNVTLPHGAPVQLALHSDDDIMEQIDTFCAMHHMVDPEHRAMLLDSASAAMRMLPSRNEGQDESLAAESKLEGPTFFKVKLRLAGGGSKEAIVQQGEDPEKVAKRLARLYGLRKKEQDLVYKQLKAVLTS